MSVMQEKYEPELWSMILEFPNYEISSYGNVYNLRKQMLMQTSLNNFGHVKITLVSEDTHKRYTRSVARLVAEAFVEPPGPACDQVMILDGDLSNVSANNLMWRPEWFVWKYSRQLKGSHPTRYTNIPVVNLVTGERYNSIVESGIKEGLLFDDIWYSTYTQEEVYPNGSIFEITR